MITQLLTVIAAAAIICWFAAWSLRNVRPDDFKRESVFSLSVWVVFNVIFALILTFTTAGLIFFITT